MCCPQGGSLGSVRSGGGRWSVLTWLQAKWAESPEASDPWKEKWGEVAGVQPGLEEQERPTCTVPVGQEQAPGMGTRTSDKRARQHPGSPSRPFLPHPPPTPPGHEGTEPKCLWLRNESLRLRPALPSNIWG